MNVPRIDRAERLIAAPVQQVFSCWTDPNLLVQWLAPRGMTARVDEFDPRAGKPFRLVLTYDDADQHGKSGDGEDVIAGQFVVVDPPHHLAFVSRFNSDDPAFQGEMRMDWTFEPLGAGTLVRIAARDVPPGISPEDHAAGMGSSMDQLAALFE